MQANTGITLTNKNKTMTDLQKELKQVYTNTPDEVKRRAWDIFGQTDQYFREIINGTKNSKPSTVLRAVQALKQAFKDCKQSYEQAYLTAQKKVNELEVEYQELDNKA